MTNNPHTDRIPLTHSIRYAVRGLPEVPNQYGPGTLEPHEITLTYRAAPDSQLGRVHAYVAGRVWVNGAELPLLPGGLYGQHYDDGLDGWPEWLAAEARLHEPAAARVVSAAPTQTDEARRERYAVAIHDAMEADLSLVDQEPAVQALFARAAEAAVALADAELAAVLRHAATLAERLPVADRYRHHSKLWDAWDDGRDAIVRLLRRMADEAQQQPDTETQAPAEDPARIDRLRPEFTEHSSIEAIDAQLRRSRSQQRRWHLRTEWLISLRQRRVEQKTRGEWPAPGPGRVADEEQGKTRKACACGQDGCEYCDVPEEPRS